MRSFGRRFDASVGRRIALLVVVEALMLGLVLLYVFRAFHHINADLEYWGRYMMAPNEALPVAMEEAATLRAELRRSDAASGADLMLSRLAAVQNVMLRYRLEWVTHAPTADAEVFRRTLANIGESELVQEELRSAESVDQHTERIEQLLSRLNEPGVRDEAVAETEELRNALRRLLRTNIEYLSIYHTVAVERFERTRLSLLLFGIGSLLVTTILGMYIRTAIAPRISSLVRKIHTFQETGQLERSRDNGQDEIAVLSNALDAGLGAIAERDRERERFLGIAAHELKTPLTSIVGYTQAAIDHPDPKVRDQALAVVRRQAHRLGRLIQDLLWAASARQGHLAFRPKPSDLTAICRKTICEIEGGTDRFELRAPRAVHLLADEELLSHACWQILSYALAVASKDVAVEVEISKTNAHVALDVSIPRICVPLDELERAFAPFEVVQYESRRSRYAVGLYLSREIARLHGGTLRATEGEATDRGTRARGGARGDGASSKAEEQDSAECHHATLRLELPA